MQQDFSPSLLVNAIWILLGCLIVVGNTTTVFFMWRGKIANEKDHPGTRNHSIWNLEATNVAYGLVGLTLATASIVRLSSVDELPKGACDSFGFFLAFFFHFAAIGILLIQVDQMFHLWKPFSYYGYVRGRSKVPFVAFVFCLLYGLVIGTLPLVNLGEYSQNTIYTTCLLKWDKQMAARLTGFLDMTIIILILGLLMVNFWQKWKVSTYRRQVNVPGTRRKETIIFSLAVSSFFLISWIPYVIAMLVSTYFDDAHTGNKGKASLFGITLTPLVFNPFVSYFLHGYFKDECTAGWRNFKTTLLAKKTQENPGQTPDGSTAQNIETTQM